MRNEKKNSRIIEKRKGSKGLQIRPRTTCEDSSPFSRGRNANVNALGRKFWEGKDFLISFVGGGSVF